MIPICHSPAPHFLSAFLAQKVLTFHCDETQEIMSLSLQLGQEVGLEMVPVLRAEGIANRRMLNFAQQEVPDGPPKPVPARVLTSVPSRCKGG